MKRVLAFITGVVLLAGTACAQDAAAPASQAAKAKVMVQKAVAFYKANGLEATIKAVNDTKGEFVDGDLYIFIHSFDGINLARGDGNLKRLGSNVLDSKDPDGKLFVVEMIKNAQAHGSGLTVYGFKNPTTGKLQQKHSYYEKIDGALIGCGYYEDQ